MRVFSVLVPLFLLAPVLTVADGAATGSTTAPAAQDGRVRVAVGNVREGSLVDYPVDRRSDSDRRRFARLVLRGAPPDVVLLQEVLGTAGHVAAALNARARAGGVPARYAVATGTAHGHSRGHCDGARAGRFSLLRSSSILVNTRTVTDVRRRAAIRTWGRWGRQAWPATGRRGFGCTEHPAAQVTVRTPEGMLTAQLVSAHVAPVGPLLKGRAIDTLRGELAARHRDSRTDLALMGGDLNMTRCRYQAKGETVGCEPRAPTADCRRQAFATSSEACTRRGLRVWPASFGESTSSTRWASRCRAGGTVATRPTASTAGDAAQRVRPSGGSGPSTPVRPARCGTGVRVGGAVRGCSGSTTPTTRWCWARSRLRPDERSRRRKNGRADRH